MRGFFAFVAASVVAAIAYGLARRAEENQSVKKEQ